MTFGFKAFVIAFDGRWRIASAEPGADLAFSAGQEPVILRRGILRFEVGSTREESGGANPATCSVHDTALGRFYPLSADLRSRLTSLREILRATERSAHSVLVGWSQRSSR